MYKRLALPTLLHPTPCKPPLTRFSPSELEELFDISDPLPFADQTRAASQSENFQYNGQTWGVAVYHGDGRLTGHLGKTKLTLPSHLVTLTPALMPSGNCVVGFDVWQERLGES